MSLYFQPSKFRSMDNSLPTAPDSGLDVGALIDELTNRINQASRKIEYMVDKKALAKIILTDRDIVLMGDQVNIVGQVNIVDWIRDISGNPTGGIDPSSITRITGGKIQTGVIQSTNWSVGAGSQFNLDTGTIVTGGSGSPKFSVTAGGLLTCVDAVVTGHLQAGSIIAGSVTLNTALGPTLDEIAAGVDIQAALSAGVGNILAGVGSNFRLNVDTANAFVVFQHKDAVYNGTAPAGSNKPALGISAAGIGAGYNRASDGQWVNSFAIDSSGNASFLGTVSAGSVISASATVSGNTLSSIISDANAGAAISDALKISGTTLLKGVLKPDNTGALATGTITWNSTTGALTGGTGIAITEWGIIGANAGVATFTLQASNGAATFKGDISGGSNIDIDGAAKFGGAFSGGGNVCSLYANTSNAARYGIVANSGTDGLGAGVFGIGGAGSSTGVSGAAGSSGGYGVVGINNFGGVALRASGRLEVVGSMTITSTSLVTNLNADLLDGKQSGLFCQIVVCDTGTCTVSGNGFNLRSTVAGTRVRGTSNFAYIESTSDIRLKRNYWSESLGLDFLMKLKPKRYQLKDSELYYHGFIAQQVQKHIPEEWWYKDSLLQKHEDGMLGVDYTSLIAPIVKAIQELKAEIDLLKSATVH